MGNILKPNYLMWLLLILVGLMVLYPFYMFIYGTLSSAPPGGGGHLTFANYIETFTSLRVYETFLATFFVATSKTVLAGLIGLFLAFMVTRTDIPFRGVIEICSPIPFLIPALFSSIGWAYLANPSNGLLNEITMVLFPFENSPFNIYSYGGIIFVMAQHSAAFIFLLLVGTLRHMDPSLEESARMSGANRIKTFLTVTLPILTPSLLGVSILSFIRGLESFEVPVILGNPAGISIFTNEIYNALRHDSPPRYGYGMTIGMIIVIITAILIIMQWKLMAKRSYVTVTGKGFRPQLIKLGKWRWPSFFVFVLFFLLSVVFPLGIMVLQSVSKAYGNYTFSNLTLDNYIFVLSDGLFQRALGNTLFLSIFGAFFCLLLCSLIAYVITKTKFKGKKALEMIGWLPWTLPGIVLGLAMLWAFIRIPGPFVLYGTIWILMLAYIIKGLPLGIREMSSSFIHISDDLEESSRTTGASWLYTFRKILMPLVSPGFIAAWLVLIATFSREVAATAFLYGHGSEVLSIIVLSYWEGGRGQYSSVIAVVMLIFMLLLLFIEKIYRERDHARKNRG